MFAIWTSKCLQFGRQNVSILDVKMFPNWTSKCFQFGHPNVSNLDIQMFPIWTSKCFQFGRQNVSNLDVKMFPIWMSKCLQSILKLLNLEMKQSFKLFQIVCLSTNWCEVRGPCHSIISSFGRSFSNGAPHARQACTQAFTQGPPPRYLTSFY